MKEVTFYEASDGKAFRSATACRRHEKDVENVERWTRQYLLKPPTKHNGEVFVRQPPESRKALIARLESVGHGNPRISDDSDSAYNKLWFRIMCIDDQNREWGQPYFANHPNPEATEDPR